jgi:spore maturation protein CgeB
MMRLLISGSRRNTNTVGSFIISNFNGGVEYEVLDYPDRFAELLDSKLYRVLYRIFPLLFVRMMDKLFVEQVRRFRPEVVLIFKGMEISKWSLKKVRSGGVRLVNFNFDHPFSHFSRGTGNRFVTEAIPFYDLHISYSSFVAAQLREKFQVKTTWIPFGFHLTDSQYAEVLAENRPELRRLCLVANPDDYRVESIRNLVREGCPVDLYGFGWERYFESTGLVTIHAPRKANSFWSDPTEFWKVLRQYRVQLNFFRPHNDGSHNLRTFEVPAVGGILLTPASFEQQRFFEVGKEIFCYTDQKSLLEQSKWLLGQDASVIEEVRVMARNRSVLSDYSYKRRTSDLLQALNTLITSDGAFANT